MVRRTIVALACSIAMAGTLTACTSNETQEEAEAAVCTSLASVRTAVDGVKALSADSTFDEVDAARRSLASAIDDLKQNAADLNEADVAALEAARDDIADAVKDVSSGDTLSEAATSVTTSTTALDAALTEIDNGVQCP